jgi:hypothetical protein
MHALYICTIMSIMQVHIDFIVCFVAMALQYFLDILSPPAYLSIHFAVIHQIVGYDDYIRTTIMLFSH